MSQQEAVFLDIADGIARIRMNRLERLNALDDWLNVGLDEALLLTQLLGPRRAFEVFILGEPMNGETALSLGLVNLVLPADELTEEVEELAAGLPGDRPVAYASVRRLVHQATTASLVCCLRPSVMAGLPRW